MKVKVNVKHVPLNQVEYFLNEALSEALADLDAAHREIERLIQENKDLRLAEARTLSDKKKAEADLSALKKQMHDQEEKACDEYTKVFEELVSLRSKFSDTCAERDNLQAAYKQVQASISQIVLNFDEDRKTLEAEIKRVCDEKQDLFIQIEDAEQEAARWKRSADQNAELAQEEIQTNERLTKQIVDMGHRIDELLGQIAAHKMGLDKKEIESWKKTAENLAETVRSLELEKNEAHARIDELQDLLVDASDTIVSLKTQIELRPKFTNLWNLLQENGLIVNTEEGPHNNG